jgi:hypothetical protein
MQTDVFALPVQVSYIHLVQRKRVITLIGVVIFIFTAH